MKWNKKIELSENKKIFFYTVKGMYSNDCCNQRSI